MTRDIRKDVLTTGEVAQICHVAPRTVSKWFDSGDLRGYRVPGSRSRRIPREQLRRFMQEHGLPLEALEGGLCRVLLVGQFSPDLAQRLAEGGAHEVQQAGSAFEAGLCVQRVCPHAVVVDLDGGDQEALALCKALRDHESSQPCKLLAARTGLDARAAQEYLAQGVDVCLAKPVWPGQLAQALSRVMQELT